MNKLAKDFIKAWLKENKKRLQIIVVAIFGLWCVFIGWMVARWPKGQWPKKD